jgi:acylphosphatase
MALASAAMQCIRHVIIRGQVQGVGYRAWVEDTALIRGLDGWVRNRRDGTVEAVFAGSAEEVAAMIEACRQGPAAAYVEAIDQRDGSAADLSLRRDGEGFSVLGTA